MAILVLIVPLLLRTMNGPENPVMIWVLICAFGFFAMITFQSIINLGMCLEPTSCYGCYVTVFQCRRLSAACLYLGFGLVQNVYMHKKRKGQNSFKFFPLDYQTCLIIRCKKKDFQSEVFFYIRSCLFFFTFIDYHQIIL